MTASELRIESLFNENNMSKRSFTHYYIQSQEEGDLPRIVVHTLSKSTQEHYYKFADRKKAKEFLEVEKKAAPDVKFRIVKVTETFDTGSWI